jgi:hypothetical protein
VVAEAAAMGLRRNEDAIRNESHGANNRRSHRPLSSPHAF